MSGRIRHGRCACLLPTSHITSCQGKLLGVFSFLINQLVRCKLQKVIITDETEAVVFIFEVDVSLLPRLLPVCYQSALMKNKFVLIGK